MLKRLAGHLKNNVVAYIALMVSVISGGGGYALAATTTRHKTTRRRHPTTLVACVSNRTGEMFLHRRGRCSRGHHKIRWSIRGPRGKTGATGPAGPVGTPAPSIFAAVDASSAIQGAPIIEKGLTVSRTGVGVYSITITDPTCGDDFNAPVVTATSRYAGASPPAGAAPIAFIQSNDGVGSTQPFTVQTGYISGGSFTPADLNFDVLDTCLPVGGSAAARR